MRKSPIDRAVPWIAAAACMGPAAWLVYRLFANQLGVNPIEELTRELGVWGLRLILAGLAITPLARILRRPKLIRLRRPVGLAAFAYVSLHLATYVGLDHFFDWAAIGKDIAKRPFITIGMAAFVLITPLAITSTNAMLRRIGPRAWRRLHQLVYLIGAMGVVHYYLLVKADHRPPLVYGAILALLLGYRVVAWLWRKRPARATARLAT